MGLSSRKFQRQSYTGCLFLIAETYTPCALHRFLSDHFTKIAFMDRASQVLVQALYIDGPRLYRTLAGRSNVLYSTLHHRDRGRESKEAKAQHQQYLTSEEEKAVVKLLLLMSNFRQPVRIKFLPPLAFSIARRRSTTNKSINLPGKNWPRAFEKRHLELKAKRVKTIDWKRHESNI